MSQEHTFLQELEVIVATAGTATLAAELKDFLLQAGVAIHLFVCPLLSISSTVLKQIVS